MNKTIIIATMLVATTAHGYTMNDVNQHQEYIELSTMLLNCDKHHDDDGDAIRQDDFGVSASNLYHAASWFAYKRGIRDGKVLRMSFKAGVATARADHNLDNVALDINTCVELRTKAGVIEETIYAAYPRP